MKHFPFIIAFELSLAVECFPIAAPREKLFLSTRIEGFLTAARTAPGGTPTRSSSSSRLFASPLNDDDDEGEDMIDVNSLGDWRVFRMNLAAAAASSSEGSEEGQQRTLQGGGGEQQQQPPTRKNLVSKLNEDLLKSQNSALADEYISTAWAHETSQPELGGLVCRLPVEAEIYRNKSSKLGAKLQRMLLSNNENNIKAPELMTPLIWYRGAQKLIKEEMVKVQKSANRNNEIDATKLTPEALDFLQMFMDNQPMPLTDHQSTWQEVCLVVDQNDDAGECTTVVLNRPISRQANEELAKLILFGQKTAIVTDKTQRLVNFLNAFEDLCAVYVGGPDEQEEPAMLIHGISGLEGAVELSPFSNIYKGGLDAAIRGIMDGKHDPLEFRFFIGRHTYKDSILQRMVYAGKYQPVACARSIALKQCIGLPKPLWNEVLEMCGGELKEISKLELLKRDDVQIEMLDDDMEDEDEYYETEDDQL